MVIEKERGIRLAMAEKIVRQYKATQLTNITWSVDPEIRLVDTSGVFEVHSVTMDFKDDSPSAAAAAVTRYFHPPPTLHIVQVIVYARSLCQSNSHKFFVGTMNEAKAISTLFDKVKTGDLTEVIRVVVYSHFHIVPY